ncbi:Hypothetical protein SLIV_26868 [Streptomyces lividans TK24]|uniref:Uncharacterized protein n=2 Tax=Streptomyces lividans TaxID=1916 RepID=A0A7U9DNF8_STRLI|nr:hypothetical protein SLI_2494 [Streptomyces lividans 1326]QNR95638.1 Hypothetical protein SLIV_26868 [Streptomyces lividans TK24]QSJ11867.1 Hypothetical protein SLIVDG2_26868 [Streptomyces lividans]QTD72777.1 Hypothetical protein SLIVYQS_26868 [Streptomyces lividans TK24] [Streptomyces lividans]
MYGADAAYSPGHRDFPDNPGSTYSLRRTGNVRSRPWG